MKKIEVLLVRFFALIWIAATLSVTLISLCSFNISSNILNKELLDYCLGEPTNLTDIVDPSSSNDTEIERIASSPIKNYFHNLNLNFGYNEKGSCGYVALGMLLTYYDSYYDDAIVPEQYDATAHLSYEDQYKSSSSPGSKEWYVANLPNKVDDYIELLVDQYANTSLHAKLISIGNDLKYKLGTSPDSIYNILNKYLEDNQQISSDDWVITKYFHNKYKDKVPGKNITYSQMMLNDIKMNLKLGIPVLTSIRIDDDNGHVAIAYDYDEQSDKVYAHFGWHNKGYHSYIFNYGYSYIRGYITLTPVKLHTHSNNYILQGIETCSCKLPNHIHSYQYKSKNSLKHTCTCFCDYTTEKVHKFTKRGTGAYLNYVMCEDCGYMKLDDGSLTPIRPTSLVTKPEINYEG